MSDYSTFPYRLRSAVWEITLACCFQCRYCGSRGGRAREGELTTDECINVARQLASLGCRRVSLIGGEVFMRDDWSAVAGELTRLGVAVCVITNGFRMTGEIISELKKAGIESVAVSLDGPERVHDASRQNGSYRRATEAIRVLCKAGIPVSVITALRADNAPLLGEFYHTLARYPIFAWQIQACSPMGNARENGIDVSFDASEVLRFVASLQRKAPFAVGVADNIGYYTPEEGNIRGARGCFFDGCGAGLVSVGIDSVGNVRGCESMNDERFIEGNLRERTLKDIWTDPDAFAYNRRFLPSMLTGACAVCPHGDGCAGGCRSYNYFTTGRLYENRLCPLSSGGKTVKKDVVK